MSLVQKHFFTFFAKWLYVLNLFSANQYFPKVVKSKMKIKKVNLFNLGSALIQIDDFEQLYLIHCIPWIYVTWQGMYYWP